MNLQKLNAIRAQVIEKAEKPFEKARGKTAFLGEVRIIGGKKWVKTANGWVYQNKNGTHTHYNSATKETERASDEHVIHYHESVNKDTDKAIESHAKGELPKSEVNKHFEDKNTPNDDEINDLALKLSQFARVTDKKKEIANELKNIKYSDNFEPMSDISKLTEILNFTSDEGTKNYVKIGFRHLIKEQPKVEDKPKEKLGSLDKNDFKVGDRIIYNKKGDSGEITKVNKDGKLSIKRDNLGGEIEISSENLTKEKEDVTKLNKTFQDLFEKIGYDETGVQEGSKGEEKYKNIEGVISIHGGEKSYHPYRGTQDNTISESIVKDRLQKIGFDKKYNLESYTYDPGSEKGWKASTKVYVLVPKKNTEKLGSLDKLKEIKKRYN